MLNSRPNINIYSIEQYSFCFLAFQSLFQFCRTKPSHSKYFFFFFLNIYLRKLTHASLLSSAILKCPQLFLFHHLFPSNLHPEKPLLSSLSLSLSISLFL
uniref:Uncharacterized protein n=1 Tax=Opuntia streptacantha TaxID=393608 RepID=A0A7C9E5D9_OPUST